jgi:Ca2+/H+ antiporter
VITPALPLSFRPVELAAMGAAVAAVAIVLWDGRGKRLEGWALVGVYGVVVLVFLAAGNR